MLGKDSASARTYLVFSLALNASNTELHVSAGATLRASDDMAAWNSGQGPGRGSAIIAACSQVCCKRYTNAFQTLRKRIPSCGYSECVITRRSTFARDYETFINVDDDTYRRDSRVARLVIRYFRFVTFVTRALPARFT